MGTEKQVNGGQGIRWGWVPFKQEGEGKSLRGDICMVISESLGEAPGWLQVSRKLFGL